MKSANGGLESANDLRYFVVDSCGPSCIHVYTLTSMPRTEVRITMTRDLYREVVKAAKKDERTLAEWVRRAILQVLDRNQEHDRG